MRSWLYRLAKAIGDGQAVKKNKIPARIRRRLIGKALSRLIR